MSTEDERLQHANEILTRVVAVVRRRLPPGITLGDFDGFLARNHAVLVAILDRQFPARGHHASAADSPHDLCSATQRTAANLAAMRVAAAKRPNEMTEDNRRALAADAGWGDLSIDGAPKQFPLDFPAPEPRGLIHENYTPTKVAREVARVIRPLVETNPEDEGAR